MAPRSREEIIALCATAPEQVADLVMTLYVQVEALEARVRELQRRLGQNSGNSGKPPSTDGYQKPAPKSLRTKSGHPSGGQPGHPGHRLEFREDPDHTVVHRPSRCRSCGGRLATAPPGEAVDRRQVFELQARVEVTEHQVHAVRCACCGDVTQGEFPPDVVAPTQYGPDLKAFVAYCDTYQLLPTERICELVYDLTGHRLSEGTLYNLNTTLAGALVPFAEHTRALLSAEPVAHFDESGVRVQGKLHWAHVACTALLTLYTVHEKRGEEAMHAAGILPAFTGVAIHDCWGSYWNFACAHALCNVHLERELQAVWEFDLQPWAGAMRALLYTAARAVAAAALAGEDHLSAEQLAAVTTYYDDLIAQGLAANPLPDPPPGPRRGRPKKSKARNLVERLQARAEAVLRFLHDFRVPYSNNQAERDMRMVKTQQKISGTFRSKTAAEEFFRIRSYISTVRKQGLPVLDCLRQALQGHPVLPAAASPALAPGATPSALLPITPPAPPPAGDLVPLAPTPPVPAATPTQVTVMPPSPNDRGPQGQAPVPALPALPPVCPDLSSALAALAAAAPALTAVLPPCLQDAPSSILSRLVDRCPASAAGHREQEPAQPRPNGHLLVPLGASP